MAKALNENIRKAERYSRRFLVWMRSRGMREADAQRASRIYEADIKRHLAAQKAARTRKKNKHEQNMDLFNDGV